MKVEKSKHLKDMFFFNHEWQRQASHAHVWEAGTGKYLTFFHKNRRKMINCLTVMAQQIIRKNHKELLPPLQLPIVSCVQPSLHGTHNKWGTCEKCWTFNKPNITRTRYFALKLKTNQESNQQWTLERWWEKRIAVGCPCCFLSTGCRQMFAYKTY